jgi:hypothetical protein
MPEPPRDNASDAEGFQTHRWPDYIPGAITVCCAAASLAVLGYGYYQATVHPAVDAGRNYFDALGDSVLWGTILALLGVPFGVFAQRTNRPVAGLTICIGMLLVCLVLWAWILGYLHWIYRPL